MASTARKSLFNTPEKRRSPENRKVECSTPSLSPSTPQISTQRRCCKKIASQETSSVRRSLRLTPDVKNGKICSREKANHLKDYVYFSPSTPDLTESKKRKGREQTEIESKKRKRKSSGKRRIYFKKVVYDGCDFAVGDSVYVKKREDDDEDPEVECQICFNGGDAVMVECDYCLGGFHLQCLNPPLIEVPEGDWICFFCESLKAGKKLKLPTPPQGKRRKITAREKLLSCDIWATRVERLWMEVDGSYHCRARWYMIPEETPAGRQQHNLKRELYLTNEVADIEMESVIRQCYVMGLEEFAHATGGDDVYVCEYEYDNRWHSFKRARNELDEKRGKTQEKDEEWDPCRDSDLEESDGDIDDYDEESISSSFTRTKHHEIAANTSKGRVFGLQKIGTKSIPEHVRNHKPTELERARAKLLLSALPKCLPCRNKEIEEITTFVRGALCEDQCLGRCLYIHGVPGTGKTMSVMAVMRSLRSETEKGCLKPYCFVETNGLKLSSPENIYRVIYEAISGYRVGWKKALSLLNDRFSNGIPSGKASGNKPCVLLIDEMDLLVTKNQSVLYNILDWPTRPHSKLIVIGIANTMDLPEKLLPRISSRMGVQRLCFLPYNYLQLQEIVTSRLTGIDAFEKEAIEFASRKVAAISGDARRVLEICRRAAELVDNRNHTKLPNPSCGDEVRVRICDVDSAVKEMIQAPHIQVMKYCSKFGKIFLTAMVHEHHKTGTDDTNFEKVGITVFNLCTSNGEKFPGWDALLRIGCKLGECRIIICEAGVRHSLQKLQLNFPSNDVVFALKDSSDVPWITKYL